MTSLIAAMAGRRNRDLAVTVAAAAVLLPVVVVGSQSPENLLYVACGLVAASLALVRLSWAYAALLLLFIMDVASSGYGMASPPRVTGLVVGVCALWALGWRMNRDGWARGRPSWWLLFMSAFLACGVLSFVVSIDRGLWFSTLVRLLLFASLAVTGYACVQTWRDLRTVLWVVLAGLCGAAVLGIVQYATQGNPFDVHVHHYYGAIRATSTATAPHYFAFMEIVAVGYGLALLASVRTRAGRVAAAVGTALACAGLLTTMARSGLIAGVGVMLISYALAFRPRSRRGTLVSVLAALMAMAAIVAVMPAPIRARFFAARSKSESSVSARSRTASTGLAIALDNPLGVGLGNADQYYTLYREPDEPSGAGASHCGYLELAETTGWIGLALFLMIILATHLRVRAAEIMLYRSGLVSEARLLMGLRFILYALLGLMIFWHQIMFDKFIWASIGMMHAGAALGCAPDVAAGPADRGR